MSAAWLFTTGQRHDYVWMRKHRLKITPTRWVRTQLPRFGRSVSFPGLPKSILGISRLFVLDLSGGRDMCKLLEWEGNLAEYIYSSVRLLGCRCVTSIIAPTAWQLQSKTRPHRARYST